MGEGAEEIMLFGVRVVVDSLRKSVSLNNLSQYELPPSSVVANAVDGVGGGGGGGYASADEVVPHQSSSASRAERKRGVPWTEEEHKLFIMGLKRVGKGDWRGISRNFVKSRTPTQVASHAQKYFLRHTNLNRRRRRTSLFDITTDTVSTIPAEEEQTHDQDKNKTGIQSHSLPLETSNVANISVLQPFPATSTTSAFPVPVVSQVENLLPVVQHSEATNPSISAMLLFPILLPSCASPVYDLNLDLNLKSIPEPSQLSLNLSLASNQRETSSGQSAFQVLPCYNNGDSIISVS